MGSRVWRPWTFSPLKSRRKGTSDLTSFTDNTATKSKALNYMETLPTELVLHVFSFLELQPYILAHGVCKEWQRLLPLAYIHPIRRRMYDLFRDMLLSPLFLETRGFIVPNLKQFDRQAYINALLSQYPAIPEEFRFWILEWPARMATWGSWPALPLVHGSLGQSDDSPGVNWLAYKFETPELLALVYDYGTPNAKFIPALPIFRDVDNTTWLIFDKDERGVFGRVFVNKHEYQELSGMLPLPWLSAAAACDLPWDDGAGAAPRINTPFPDWIKYQHCMWYWLVTPLPGSTSTRALRRMQAPSIMPSPRFSFCSTNPTVLPSPPWRQRYERYCQELIGH